MPIWLEPFNADPEVNTVDYITFEDDATKWEASTCAPDEIFDVYDAGV